MARSGELVEACPGLSGSAYMVMTLHAWFHVGRAPSRVCWNKGHRTQSPYHLATEYNPQSSSLLLASVYTGPSPAEDRSGKRQPVPSDDPFQERPYHHASES